MKNLILSISVVWLIGSITSCSSPEREVFVDPVLQPYWTEFQMQADRLGVQLNVGDLTLSVTQGLEYKGKSANGLCHKTKYGCRIEINQYMISKYSEDGQYSKTIERTVFHELGHGLFGRGHNDMYFEKGDKLVPSSLMTQTTYYKDYDTYRDYYLQELFGLTYPEDLADQYQFVINQY